MIPFAKVAQAKTIPRGESVPSRRTKSWRATADWTTAESRKPSPSAQRISQNMVNAISRAPSNAVTMSMHFVAWAVMVTPRPRVVVVGAGFGGLAAARALRHVPVDVVLVDRHNYHLFTPLLYQVANAQLDPGEIAQPVRAILRRQRNLRMWMAEVVDVDLDRKVVHTDHGEVDYDYLLLAPGSTTNYFGNHELAQQATGLKTLEEGLGLRNHVLSQFEQARWTDSAEERRRMLTFAVVGGGPTGVEYAGSLMELIKLVLAKDYPGMKLDEVKVLLLEAGSELLPAFDLALRRYADRRLKKMGVEIRYGARVSSYRDTCVELSGGGSFPAGTLVWTAGVRGADLLSKLGRPLQKNGTLKVEPTLQLPARADVFVIGDAADLEENGAPLPQLAPVAQQQARRAAANIAAHLKGEPMRPFRYFDKGTMATIGRNAAVAQVGRIRVKGFLGWLGWLFLHLLLIVSLRSRLIVFINWTWDYFFKDRPVRLILTARSITHDDRDAVGS